jgi:hypothetical protein
VRALSLFWFWIEPCLSNLINGFLTIVAILHSLSFLLGLEVSVTRSFTIPFPKSIFLFYFYSYTIYVLYHLVIEITCSPSYLVIVCISMHVRIQLVYDSCSSLLVPYIRCDYASFTTNENNSFI